MRFRPIIIKGLVGGAALLGLAMAGRGALATGPAAAAATDKPRYLDPSLDFETRAADLVSRMTVEEKISQLTNQAAEIERLDVPAYEWWNECLHGVARAGVATVFPQAIGLAATFDEPLIHEMATVISNEARAKHHQFVRQGKRGRYQGLTFWSPNINIFRDPRWGRGQETYGEDPYLTGRLGTAFVKGLQGDDPRYYRVIATAKHYAVHSGPETDRHHFDARPTERDLNETYLPAFRALVKDGKVASVMGAYNRVNGESASASQRLLGDILRKEWGFGGYVVSDCDSIDDIFSGHHLVATPEEAAALGVTRGCDLDCGATYRKLGVALERGLLKEQDIDVALRRLMLARMKLGMFDPLERVAYAQIPYRVNDAPEHDQLARRVAQESIVLLKNDGLLPLRKDLAAIAVVGPNADDLITLLGNYNGTPSKPVTALAGIRNAVSPATKVLYARGVDLVEGRQDPRAASVIDSAYLRPAADAAERGLRGQYFNGRELRGEPVLTRVDPRVEFRWYRGSPTDELVARGELLADRALGSDDFSIRWTGKLLPPVSGEYEFTVTGNDGVRLLLDGRKVLEEWSETSVARDTTGKVVLEAGRAYDLTLEYFEAIRDAEVRLGWRLPGSGTPLEEALAAAKAADVVVFVGGLTAEVEGEEMKVSYPGFSGGDRTDVELPAVQRKMIEALYATGKPVVLVLMTGSALGVTWAQEHLRAIVLGWYPGQQGGNALADVLFGDESPAGRLPVTFYKSVAQLPPFTDYHMEGRTYRFFRGEPLYPFGHGLSYTRFEYSGLQLSRTRLGEKDRLEVSLNVKNAGGRDGDDVVQLYVRDPASSSSSSSSSSLSRVTPTRELRGFERIRLKAGEQRQVRFSLVPAEDFHYYDEQRKAFAVKPGEFEIELGASSRDIRLKGRVVVIEQRGAASHPFETPLAPPN
jgi:beta-glucosidase